MEFLSERRLERINRAVVSGRIIPFLAFVTLLIALAGALVVWIFARGEFDSFGESIWWAAQTVTTVGYGDVIPQTRFSKFVAVLVMIFGITTVSLMTAVVTSALMAWTQKRFDAEASDVAEEQSALYLSALQRIEDRLDSIERKLPG
jgi:voltage-gated potassium channel